MARKKKKYDWKKLTRREVLIIVGFAILALVVWIYFETSYLPSFPGLPGELPKIDNFNAADSFEQALKDYQNKKSEYDNYLAKNKYVGRIYRAITLIPYPSFLLIRIIRWYITRKKPRIKPSKKKDGRV